MFFWGRCLKLSQIEEPPPKKKAVYHLCRGPRLMCWEPTAAIARRHRCSRSGFPAVGFFVAPRSNARHQSCTLGRPPIHSPWRAGEPRMYPEPSPRSQKRPPLRNPFWEVFDWWCLFFPTAATRSIMACSAFVLVFPRDISSTLVLLVESLWAFSCDHGLTDYDARHSRGVCPPPPEDPNARGTSIPRPKTRP